MPFEVCGACINSLHNHFQGSGGRCSVLQVLGVSKKAGSLNFLQEAVLIWSYQQTAHARRVAGVVDDSWGAGQVEEEEEHFSPTIYRQFDKNTIHAPLLWWVWSLNSLLM